MASLARRLSILAAILAGLLILSILTLPYLVSLDAMRARVISAAEGALHRKVEIGTMRLQIFSGLGAGVDRILVRNPPGWESPALVSADRVSVKVAFWPLLSRRVVVTKIVLDGATVAIERDPADKWNIDDFLSAGKRDSAPATATAAAAALLVSRIEIARGRALFVDRRITPGQTVTLSLDDLTGRITDIGPTSPARFDLMARFLTDAGRNLTLQGSLGPPPAGGPVGTTALHAAFEARNLTLKRLAPYVAAFQATDPGTLSMKGTADGALLGAIALAGNLSLVPPGPSSPMPASNGTIALTLDWPKGTLVIARSLFDVARLPLSLEGRVDDLHGQPRVDLRVATPGDVAIDSVTGLPGLAGTLPAGVKLGGRVRLEAEIQGPSSQLDTRASVDAISFAVKMNGEPMLAAPSARATLGSRGKAPLSGKITMPSGKLKNVPFENLVADWSWDKGALMLAPSAAIYGGTLAARVESDFAHAGSESRLALDLRGVQAQPLVESATTARNVFAGTLNGKFSLSSKGLSWDAITRTGRGEGHLAVVDADLRTVQLMPEIARSLSTVGKVGGFQVPASLESTRFSRLETSLRLADGRLATPDLSLSGRDIAATADGSLGLDKTLAYQGHVILGPAVVKSLGNAGKYVADPEGRLTIPFRASGPISGPKVTIDESIVVDLGRRLLARQTQQKIGGTAGKVLGDVLDSGDGKTASPADLLQQFLKPPAPRPTPTPAPRP